MVAETCGTLQALPRTSPPVKMSAVSQIDPEVRMAISTTHSAPSTAAAFVYQFERALLHIARGGAGTEVGIETCDDVAVKSKDDLNLWEQDKLTFQEDSNPLTDKSKNLWNSLLTWLKAVRTHQPVEGKLELFLVTNAPVPRGLTRR